MSCTSAPRRRRTIQTAANANPTGTATSAVSSQIPAHDDARRSLQSKVPYTSPTDATAVPVREVAKAETRPSALHGLRRRPPLALSEAHSVHRSRAGRRSRHATGSVRPSPASPGRAGSTAGTRRARSHHRRCPRSLHHRVEPAAGPTATATSRRPPPPRSG